MVNGRNPLFALGGVAQTWKTFLALVGGREQLQSLNATYEKWLPAAIFNVLRGRLAQSIFQNTQRNSLQLILPTINKHRVVFWKNIRGFCGELAFGIIGVHSCVGLLRLFFNLGLKSLHGFEAIILLFTQVIQILGSKLRQQLHAVAAIIKLIGEFLKLRRVATILMQSP